MAFNSKQSQLNVAGAEVTWHKKSLAMKEFCGNGFIYGYWVGLGLSRPPIAGVGNLWISRYC